MSKQPNVVAIVQARMGSTRLPGKVLKKVAGEPLLYYLIERLKKAKLINQIIIATTEKPEDDKIIDFCMEQKLPFFRGSEENVLSRFYHAAFDYSGEVIIRVTSDCPLIDPEVVDQVVKIILNRYPEIDYASNTIERTFPRGLDVEAFTFNALQKAYIEANSPEELEHVTYYIYSNPKEFNIKSLKGKENNSDLRLTVDTPEDFELISLIINKLQDKNPNYRTSDIVKLLEEHPEWKEINAHIKQKAVRSG